MPEELNSQVEDKLKTYFANPQTRAAIASVISSPRPVGWSHRSKASYFKKVYAEEIKEHIDQQIATGKDLIFRYATWCEKLGVSERTLYTRINQSILFLVQRLDPDGVYSKWYEGVDIDCKSSKFAIVISVAKVEASRNIKPELVEPRQSLPQWRKKLMDWLESNSNEPFVEEGLALGPEEVLKLREEFLTNDGLLVDINFHAIRIIKA